MSEARMAPSGQGRVVAGAESEPWWGDLLAALRQGTSIHALARQFDTNCRRIRRALARQGMRAHGHEVEAGGLIELAPFVSRLGKEPDSVIAREAHVTPQAVKGERNRLGIGPFKPQRRVTLTRDDEAWIRGPVRRRREKIDLEAELTVVHRAAGPAVDRGSVPEARPVSLIRRPPSMSAPGLPASPAREAAPAMGSPGADGPRTVVRRPGSRSEAPVPEVSTRSFRGPSAVVVVRTTPDGNATVIGREADDFTREARPLGPGATPAAPGNARPGFRPTSAPAAVRAYVEERERRQKELDELLNAPRRERDSTRARLVRAGEARIMEPDPEPVREVVSRRRGSDTPAWRAVDPGAARQLADEAERNARREAEREQARQATLAAEHEANVRELAAREEAAREAATRRVSPPAVVSHQEARPPQRRGATVQVALFAPAQIVAGPRPRSTAVTTTFRAWFLGFSDAVEVQASDLPGAIAAARAAVPDCFELTGVERAV